MKYRLIVQTHSVSTIPIRQEITTRSSLFTVQWCIRQCPKCVREGLHSNLFDLNDQSDPKELDIRDGDYVKQK